MGQSDEIVMESSTVRPSGMPSNAQDNGLETTPSGFTPLDFEMQEIRAPAGDNPPRSLHGAQIGEDGLVLETGSVQGVVIIRSKFRMVAVMVALLSGLFIAALNQTMVATATPTICSELNSASGYSWIAGVYLLATGASVPIWAKLSDIWGRKPMLLAGSVTYLCASIFCALSVNMRMLIAGRALQGIAGGGLFQLVHITISDMFSLRSRTLMLSLLEVMWLIAGGIGPVVGGVFTQYVSWRWIFWINIPICCISFLLLLIFLDVHNPRTRMRDGFKAVDWWGSISILGTMVMILLGLDFGGEVFAWNSATVICLLVFGSLMCLIFIYAEKKVARYPLMPMNLFNNRSNIGCLVLAFMHDFVASSVEYYLPLFFQSVHGASPSRSGLYIIPLIIVQAVVGILVGVTMHRTGDFIWIIRFATIFLTLGTGLFIKLNASSTLGLIMGFQLIFGLGAGMLWEPPLIALQAYVRKSQMASATATLGFARSVATSMSIVTCGVLFQDEMQNQTPILVASGLPANITALLGGDQAAANVDLVNQITDPAQKLAVESAFADSLRNVWILCTCVSALAIVSGLMVKRSELTKEHVETKTGIQHMDDDLKNKEISPEETA